MFPPKKCLEKLKCSLCNHLLSVFPVHIKKNDPQSSICGRCELPDDDDYLRLEIYENLAETVRFPCINKEHGCKENILPENMKKHEEICSFRLKTCIFQERNQCNWTGRFNQLFEHYETDHKDLLLDSDQFEFDLLESHDFTNILLYNGEIFLFEYNYDHLSKQLKCSINPLGLSGTITGYYSQINLSTKDATLSKNFPTNGTFSSKHMDINIENICNKNDNVIMGTIIIADDERKLNYGNKLHQEISKVICQNCTCGQIIGDSLDGYGRLLNTCINCIKYLRMDEETEQFFKLIQWKCSHRGCNFIGSAYDCSTHRINCLFAPIDCSLQKNCDQQPQLRNLFRHIIEEHRDRIVELNEIVKLSIDAGSKRARRLYNVLLICHDLFGLNIHYDSPKLSFTINKFDFLPKKHNFIYEVRILDKDNVERIIIRESDNIHDSTTICLHKDQIINLLFDKTLSFKINIYNDEM